MLLWKHLPNNLQTGLHAFYFRCLLNRIQQMREIYMPISSGFVHMQQLRFQRLPYRSYSFRCALIRAVIGGSGNFCVLNAKSQKFYSVGFSRKHSNLGFHRLIAMEVVILPALQDNYMYLIIDNKTREAAVVDPVAPELVINTVRKEKLNLNKILVTHHHWDHAGGNEKLIKLSSTPLEVYGSDDRIPGLNHLVNNGDTLHIGDLNVLCIFTPCHTHGHMCYYVTAPNDERAVFTGDTLFQAGCGRFFEGTAEQMHANLIEKLGKLPGDTKVYCGHEYTLQNLAYAKHVEPKNQDIFDRIEWAKATRSTNNPTVPSTIAEEKRFNPFMRVTERSVQIHAKTNDPIDCMRVLRKEKDTFKG